MPTFVVLTAGAMACACSMKWWLNAMSSTGAHAAAVESMIQTAYPSFGYMMSRNATTAWEVWDFSDSTYSHNHAMLTSVTEWAIKFVVGIQQFPGALAWSRCVPHRWVFRRAPPDCVASCRCNTSARRGRVY